MIANFKNSDKIIVVGADRAESLLIKQLVDDFKEGTKEISLTEFYDIDGEVNGFSIDLKDKEVENDVVDETV